MDEENKTLDSNVVSVEDLPSIIEINGEYIPLSELISLWKHPTYDPQPSESSLRVESNMLNYVKNNLDEFVNKVVLGTMTPEEKSDAGI